MLTLKPPLSEQVSCLHTERISEALDDCDRRIASASFDVADIGAVDSGEVGKRLLAQPALGAKPSDIRAKARADVHR